MTTTTKSRTVKLASAGALQAQAFHNLDVYRAVRAAAGVSLTRKQARKEIAQTKERKAATLQEQAEKLAQEFNNNARADVADSLGGFVAVADMLAAVADGTSPYGLDDQENARIIAAYFKVHASNLERALFQLRVWEGVSSGKGATGHFAESLARIEA